MKITRFVAAICVATALLCPAYGEQLTGSIGASGGGGGVTPSGTFTSGDLVVGAGTTSIQDAANVSGGVATMPVALNSQRATSSAAASTCNTNSYATAFTCDLTKVNYAVGANITGTTSLGNPTSGYVLNPNMALLYGYYSNASGVNFSTSGNGGRTNGAAIYIKADALGQGDTTILFGNMFINSACPVGATSFLACASGQIVGGQLIAGHAGDYLEPIGDINCNDGGFDVACIGMVRHLSRTINTGALGAVWIGDFLNSNGSVAADVGHSVSGLWNVGFDVSNSTLGTNQAAFTAAAAQRIYLAATPGGAVANFVPTPGTDYINSPTAGKFQGVFGGSERVNYGTTASTWTFTGNLNVTGGNILVAAGQILGFRGGSTPLSSPTNAVTHFGSVDAATAVAQTTGVQSIVAGTSNVSGANWTIVGSLSTGSGTNGNIIFQVGGTGAAATVQNTAINAMVIVGGTGLWQYPTAATGTPSASLCLDASNNVIKKTTTGSCV